MCTKINTINTKEKSKQNSIKIEHSNINLQNKMLSKLKKFVRIAFIFFYKTRQFVKKKDTLVIKIIVIFSHWVTNYVKIRILCCTILMKAFGVILKYKQVLIIFLINLLENPINGLTLIFYKPLFPATKGNLSHQTISQTYFKFMKFESCCHFDSCNSNKNVAKEKAISI